ncbi:MAG: hypothetical protein H6740_26385 [Alphaproteobacteria bacterium]|nr:hypothetical protein [Alphaproteobacteria bacterium]
MQHATLPISELDPGFILAPERYDPRRRGPAHGLPLSALAERPNDTLRPEQAEPEARYLVLDTSHASEGWVQHPPAPCPAAELGSAKRVLRAGDLIVSRLRPYLRQVAWIDPALLEGGLTLLASTEFVVLRPKGPESLAFLAPYLLSAPIQAALAAAQEGGHHPRVPMTLFDSLKVPEAWVTQRDARSAEVEAQVRAARGAERGMSALQRAVEATLPAEPR